MNKQKKTGFFYWAGLLLISLAACNPAPEPISKNAFSHTEPISPAVVINAGKPEVHSLANVPPPETIDLSNRPTPVKQPAGFFVTMQNFNTDHGLALSSILCSFKDKAGNLWFGTFGNGVSKYNGKSFTNYNSSHGLPHNLINAITEDSRGNIWFSTYGGVSKYDGVSFENYTTANGLPDNDVLQSLEDSRGNIWFTTASGLCRYFPAISDTADVMFVQFNQKNGFKGKHTHAIIEDKRGSIWVSSDRGVMKYDPSADVTGKFLFTDFSTSIGLENSFINCITEDQDGLIWFGTNDGVLSFDPEKAGSQDAATVKYSADDGLISNKITSIIQDSGGTLWFGSKAGASAFNKKDASFLNFTSEQGLVNNSIICITEDASGSLWFGTSGGGLSRYDGLSTIEYAANQGLKGKAVFSIAEDQYGDLWLGMQEGGISKFEFGRQKPEKDSFTHFSAAQGLTDYYALTMFFDKAGSLWFGSGNGLSKLGRKSVLTYNSKHGLINNSVISLKEDSKGNIWTGTYEGGLSKFDGQSFTNYTTSQGLVNNTVWSTHEDKTGAIWFATRGGLSRFDGINFINFTKEQGLPDNKLSIVTEDKSGNLLIGSWGGGVSIVRKKWVEKLAQNEVSTITENIFENFNTSNGLANDVVYGILEDADGNIIIGTSLGLTILKGGLDSTGSQIAEGGIEKFNQKTGYTIKDVSNNYSMLIDSRGFVWAGTGDKLVRFDYKKVRRNSRAPRVFIQNIGINHENISWHSLQRARASKSDIIESPISIPAYVHDELNVFSKQLSKSERDTLISKFRKIRFDQIRPFHAIPENLVLPYTHNIISFDFVGIETARPFMVQYQFMLEGSDKQWSPLSHKTSAEYSNLRQGTYTFKLRAKSPDGIWSETVTYSFQVLPPWWFTWWAISLYILLFFLGLFAVRRYEMTRILLRNQLKLEKVETETLRNLDQMKSHFFANISHEFRTPLTLILGQIESVMSSGIEIREKGKLQVANRNARRLLTLINELLDLSKLEAGSMELKAANHNIVSFLKSLFFSFESLAAAKKIELGFETTSNHIPVLFDPDKMEKVFYNLMSNAFKFTPENGKIKVTIASEQSDQVVISIKDTGCGIPEDRLENIFDRFYQVDGTSTREHEGTGIGLALAKELVELHKGKLAVNSVVDEGSEFILTLPVENNGSGYAIEKLNSDVESFSEKVPADFEETELLAEAGHLGQPATKGREIILIVEDNDDVRSYIREQLEADYQVNEACHGEEGVLMAEEQIPDLIITDVMMPKMDGYQFCNAIRNNEKTSHIPMIMLTAKSALDDKITGLESGVDAYLTKPFSAKELKATIINLLHQRIQLKKRFSKSMVIKPSEVSMVSADQAFMEKVIQTIESNFGDEQFSVEMLAEKVNMSVTQLNRKLNALIDQPPGQLIRVFRLQRAADLLKQKIGSVSEISYKVGFADNAYFSRAFKKQFSCSPSEYADSN
jgi:signal transduction histidine kinase/ligand-binding sensor domain-containing protein/DNA-binding response OmpR family regulator